MFNDKRIGQVPRFLQNRNYGSCGSIRVEEDGGYDAFLQAVIGTLAMFPLAGQAAGDETILRGLVERVLEVIILIELFNTFMEYARTRHIRLSNLLDVTIVFALRELLIQLYAQVISAPDLLTLCVLVIVLVIARSIAARFTRNQPAYENEKAD